jgi:hypothetical protein
MEKIKRMHEGRNKFYGEMTCFKGAFEGFPHPPTLISYVYVLSDESRAQKLLHNFFGSFTENLQTSLIHGCHNYIKLNLTTEAPK